MMRNNALEAAHARRAELKAAGVGLKPLNPIEKARANPTSKALAVRAYWWDMSGCATNRAGPALRAEYKERLHAAKSRYRATISAICFECVGGYADPGPRQRVRDCRCRGCPLHPVRSWQRVADRTSLEKRFESKR